ncbi:hypothetical protein [Pseudomonas sp. LRF_L74]|uniref:hypothetical protein n=1 Tax=Pseudomonas sp. LRF_L74 TaxID=3369422 RepID=UPI003F5E1FE3
MSEHSSLSSEELDFIQRLFDSPIASNPLQSPSFKVDGGQRVNTMLSRLGQSSQLSLDARFDGYWMTFPLNLVEDEMHNLHLELAAPSIFEEGEVPRSLRIHLAAPIPLLDKHGRETELKVRQLSPDGLMVSGRGFLPEEFHLWLPLPGHDPIPLSARLIRSVGKQRAAYSLKLTHSEHTERLRQFIFDQHRQNNPQLCLPA